MQKSSSSILSGKFFQKYLNSQNVVPFIFVLPFLISFVLFFIYPLFSTFQMSFQEIHGFNDVRYIGFTNYKNLLNDRFLSAIRVTMTYTFWTIVILVPLPVILSVFLNLKHVGASFFKPVLFIPQLTSVIVAGIFFRFAFSDTPDALFNTIVGFFGIGPVRWLKEATPTMFALVTLCVWRWLGVNIVYFLSALQSIPREMYEVAAIDGAGPVRRFLHITLPFLKPTIIYVTTISVYGGFAMFSESYALFGTARTPGEIGSTMVGYLYQQAFVEARMGFGAAAGIVLFFMVMIINLIQLKLFGAFRRGDY
ncbi:MAG TPA: sugar ABC transporter permease [Thermoclostridium sp.]